jgi:nuclear pore complex protein Nup133
MELGPSLHEILSDALFTLIERQVVGADGLIDILTLMGPYVLHTDRELARVLPFGQWRPAG